MATRPGADNGWWCSIWAQRLALASPLSVGPLAAVVDLNLKEKAWGLLDLVAAHMSSLVMDDKSS